MMEVMRSNYDRDRIDVNVKICMINYVNVPFSSSIRMLSDLG